MEYIVGHDCALNEQVVLQVERPLSLQRLKNMEWSKLRF